MHPFNRSRKTKVLIISGFSQDKENLNKELATTFGGDSLVRSAVCQVAGLIAKCSIDSEQVTARDYSKLLTDDLSWRLLPSHSSDGQIARVAQTLGYECSFCYVDQPYYDVRYIPTISLWGPSLKKDLDHVLAEAVSYIKENNRDRRVTDDPFQHLLWPYYGVMLLSAVLFGLCIKLHLNAGGKRLRVYIGPTNRPDAPDGWCFDDYSITVAKTGDAGPDIQHFVKLAVMAAGRSDRLEFVESSEDADVCVSANAPPSGALTLPFLRFVAIPTNTLIERMEKCNRCLLVGGLDNNLAMWHLLTVKRWASSSHDIAFASNAFDIDDKVKASATMTRDMSDRGGDWLPLFDVPVGFCDSLSFESKVRHDPREPSCFYSSGKVKLTNVEMGQSEQCEVDYVGGTDAFLSKLWTTILLFHWQKRLQATCLELDSNHRDFHFVRLSAGDLEEITHKEEISWKDIRREITDNNSASVFEEITDKISAGDLEEIVGEVSAGDLEEITGKISAGDLEEIKRRIFVHKKMCTMDCEDSFNSDGEDLLKRLKPR